ncbi:hypothetical protein [Endozoicomonas elysicola]|uniref:hypothetical protein n=1 Tax=Endozoicomonas elysicola TaxID=305900 RepID=UPI00126794D5|nr:hypothetical protein [Endozoicomonas elysicola]
MRRKRTSSRVKPGCSLEERHLVAMDIIKSHIWECVYHYHRTKGVIIGREPPNDTWPTSNHTSSDT